MCSKVQQEVCDDYCANPCFEVASYEGINLIDGGLIAFGYFSGRGGKVSVDIELELESESTLTGNSEKFEDNCKLENPFWPELCDLQDHSQTLKVHATDLECRAYYSSTTCRKSWNNIESEGVRASRDVSKILTNWKGCNNQVLGAFPVPEYLTAMVWPPDIV